MYECWRARQFHDTRERQARSESRLLVGEPLPATLALPFDIRFNLEMTEQQSARNLRFSDAVILVKGNTGTIETDQGDPESRPGDV